MYVQNATCVHTHSHTGMGNITIYNHCNIDNSSIEDTIIVNTVKITACSKFRVKKITTFGHNFGSCDTVTVILYGILSQYLP